MRVPLLAAVLVAALAAGCGGESSTPEKTVSAAVSGLSKGDEKKVCEQLTEPAKRKLLEVIADDPPIIDPVHAKSCEEAIVKVHAQLSQPIRAVLEDGEVEDAKVTGDKAVVHVPGAGTDDNVQKIDGEWKITGGLFQPPP
jgi:hypothetical protein